MESLWEHVTQPERAFEGSTHPQLLKIYEAVSHSVLQGKHLKHESIAFLNERIDTIIQRILNTRN